MTSTQQETLTASDHLQFIMVQGADGDSQPVMLVIDNQNNDTVTLTTPLHEQTTAPAAGTSTECEVPHQEPADSSANPQSHECSVCGQGFARAGNLQDHMPTHTGEKPHVCTVCGNKFPRAKSLREHMVIHFDVKPHQCSICSRGFSHVSALIRHKRTHTGEKPYVCSECGKKFTQSAPMKAHIARYHPHLPVPNLREKCHECKVCKKTFTSGIFLDNHFKKRHSGEKRFQCEKCDKCFVTTEGLKGHMATSHGQGGVVCTVCGKRFPMACRLKIHMEFHARQSAQANPMKRPRHEKPIKCPKCNKSFRIMKTYEYHKQVCAIDKSYNCSECDSVFYQEEKLLLHMKKHKPFSCSECGERFPALQAAKDHMTEAHPPE